MTFKLEGKIQGGRGQESLISAQLTSFFFYLPFNITPDNKVQFVQTDSGRACYVALLLDGPSQVQQPPGVPFSGDLGDQNFKISRAAEGSISFDHLTLESVTSIHRNNEWCELRLYRGETETVEDPRWINANGWRTNRNTSITPKPNNWTRTASFGAMNSPITQSLIEQSITGEASALTIAHEMTHGTVSDKVIEIGDYSGSNSTTFPQITIKSPSNGKAPTISDLSFMTQNGIERRRGFTLIAAGAFAAQAADTMVEAWRDIAGARDVRDRLGRIAWAPENVTQKAPRLLRKLNNLSDDGARGSFSTAGETTDPVEILHLFGNGDNTIVA